MLLVMIIFCFSTKCGKFKHVKDVSGRCLPHASHKYYEEVTTTLYIFNYFQLCRKYLFGSILEVLVEIFSPVELFAE